MNDLKKYNYVISFGFGKVYETAFAQIDEIDNAAFFNFEDDRSKLQNLLYHLAFTPKLNQGLQGLLTRIVFYNEKNQFKSLLGKMPDRSKKNCVVLAAAPYRPWEKRGFFSYLKEKIPNLKIVYYCTDIIKSAPLLMEIGNGNSADLTVSYDSRDSLEYGFKYYPVPYSDLSDEYINSKCKYDICFIGAKKHRLEAIYKAYDYFSSLGLTCAFYVTGCESSEKRAGVNYPNFMSYQDYLTIESQSRCILEIMQDNDCYGNTFRVPEAIFMNKKLISNNLSLVGKEYFYSEKMRVYKDVTEITKDFIISSTEEYPNSIKAMFRPDGFLEFLEAEL